MTGPIFSTNAQDSYVDSSQPNKTYVNLARMYVSSGAQSLIFFPRTFPLGAKILSAKLRVYNDGVWAGSITLVAYRIQAKWNTSKVTWNTKPDNSGTTDQVQLVKSNAASGTQWEFDVTTMMNKVASGSVGWYGFLLNATGSARKALHSAQSANASMRPVLEITWADNPNQPTQLIPNSGAAVSVAKPTLLFDFVDVSGDTSMAGYQVQVNGTNNFTAPAFDTGEVASSQPQCDLSATTYGGIAAGGTAWWRVRVKDGAGLWSPWSEAVSFTRAAKPTVTMSNPVVGPPSYVEDTTPPVIWSVTGGSQASYRLMVEDAMLNKVLWDSGVVSGTVNTVTIPEKIITKSNYAYRVRLQVRDAIDRDATPGDLPYVEIVREFTFVPTSSTTPPTNASVVKVDGTPFVDFKWSAETAPDAFNVYRDGALVAQNLLPANVLVSGTDYKWRDLRVSGRRQHTWAVQAVVNGRASMNNPSAVAKFNHTTAWLSDENGNNLIPILNPDVDPGLTEVNELLYPLEGDPVLVTRSRAGYVGQASGLLTDFVKEALSVNLTAQQLKDRFLFFRESGRVLNFSWADEAIRCYIYDSRLKQIARADGTTDYSISFGFIEVR